MRIVYPLILILFTVCSAFAQNRIELSKDTVKIEGKVCYAHLVKKKETLYSLSKAYGVTTDVIVKNNASLSTGLKEGTVIYIPIVENGKSTSAAEVKTAAVKGPQKQKKYKRHTVKWYEDITDISQKYNVPVEALIALNNLPNGKLKARQVLQIPDAEYMSTFAPDGSQLSNGTSNDPSTAAADTTATAGAEERSGQIVKDDIVTRDTREPLEIALVLPLNSTTPDNISSNFMDFYAGALLAVKDFKQQSGRGYFHFNQPELIVNSYDLTEYNPLHTLLDVPGFEKNQLIIGPARAGRLKEVAGYATTHKIPLVSPLDNSAEALVDECKYMIQVPTSSDQQLENLVGQLAKEYRKSPAPVLLVWEKGGADASYVEAAKELLDANSIPYTDISYGILEGRTISETIIASIDTLSGTPNFALVPSNSEAFVSDAIRNLDICHNYGNTRMMVFGMPKWRNFETIHVELYHKLNLHLSIPYYVEYSSPEVEKFLMTYRALYNAEPTPYAYQGYDITRYFLDLANRYGKSFINLNEFAPAQMLQSNFNFKRHHKPANQTTVGQAGLFDNRSGLTNYATRDIIYNPDYTITLDK